MEYDTHSFSVNLAVEVGLYPAILLEYFLMMKSISLNVIPVNTLMLNEKFPYMTLRTIKDSIEELHYLGYLKYDKQREVVILTDKAL